MPRPPPVNGPMTFLDLTLPTAAENVGLDEALLLAAEEDGGGEVLRLWEQPAPAVVVGAGGAIDADLDRAACAADGVVVVRRTSGGGAVLIGPGCLCVSVVLRTDRPGLDNLYGATAFVMGKLRDAVAAAVPGVGLAGSGDLAVGGRKISGSAQRRKRHFFLHHATLLGAFDPARVARYLRPPERQPEYRAGRAHADFMTTIPGALADLKASVVAAWAPAGPYPNPPLARVRELVAEKFGNDEWTYRS